jgi:hypothetical protein
LDLIYLLEQTYDPFIRIYQHKNERDLRLALSLIGLRIARRFDNMSIFTNIAQKIEGMTWESIGVLFKIYGMMRQNLQIYKREWERIVTNDDLTYKKIYVIEGVKMAEAKEIIDEALEGLRKIDQNEKDFRTSLVGKMSVQVEKAHKESINISTTFMKRNWEEVIRNAGTWFQTHPNPKNAQEKELFILNLKYYADALMNEPDNVEIVDGLLNMVRMQAMIKLDVKLIELRFRVYKQSEAKEKRK